MVYLCIIHPLHGLVELMVVAGYCICVFLKHTEQGASLERKISGLYTSKAPFKRTVGNFYSGCVPHDWLSHLSSLSAKWSKKSWNSMCYVKCLSQVRVFFRFSARQSAEHTQTYDKNQSNTHSPVVTAFKKLRPKQYDQIICCCSWLLITFYSSSIQCSLLTVRFSC